MIDIEYFKSCYVSEGVWLWRKWGWTDLFQAKGFMLSLGPFGLFRVCWGEKC